MRQPSIIPMAVDQQRIKEAIDQARKGGIHTPISLHPLETLMDESWQRALELLGIPTACMQAVGRHAGGFQSNTVHPLSKMEIREATVTQENGSSLDAFEIWAEHQKSGFEALLPTLRLVHPDPANTNQSQVHTPHGKTFELELKRSGRSAMFAIDQMLH